MATARDIATNVLASLNHLGQETEGVFIPDIVRHIDDTIEDMVREIAAVGTVEARKLFQRVYTVSITTASGFDTVDLTSQLEAALGTDRMLMNLPFTSVLHPSSQAGELLFCADFANLGNVDLSEGHDYYSFDNKTLYINADPELTGNLSIRSYFVPTVTNLPRYYEPMLVDKLVEQFLRKKAVVKR